jgi:hypothetical protein
MSAFVEFTRRDRGPTAAMAVRVNQIKAIEAAPNAECARIILFEKFEGQDYYWTNEPYSVISERLLAAEKDSAQEPTINAQGNPVSLASRWLAQATKAAREHLDFYARSGHDLADHKITILPAKGRPEPVYLARCSCGWGQV